MEMAREIALCHHERWDGTGYPAKLAGEKIPLAARIVSVADVYDALSSQRVYKERFPHQKCVQMIKDDAGKAFDPTVVGVFLELEAEFREIALRYRDAERAVGAEPGATTTDRAADVSEETVLSAVLEFVEQCSADLSSETTLPFNLPEVEHAS